ncbi:uncharacterized protein LOC117780520 [Drosophila innubila]|uniref:uncharacterized protein LOC117780520 n=1 Tax=Drosophila innubila TaxID=198719 RepID=UPI00148D0807|nr:uncharacterized protein LOC117780520 [Drosophila innubila]
MKTRSKKQNFDSKIERKFDLSKFRPRRIPKQVLARTLEIVNDPNDEFWLNKNASCAPPITEIFKSGVKHSDTYKKLDLARKCLLTRDWENLAKLLTSNLVGDTLLQKAAYPVFSEYASILLTLKDPELLQKLQATMAPSAAHSNNNGNKSIRTEPNPPKNV